MNAAKKTSGTKEVRTGGGAVAGLLIFFIVVMVANFGYSIYQDTVDTQRWDTAVELVVFSQQISNNASKSVGGNMKSFDVLAKTRNTYESNILSLENTLREVDFKFTPNDDLSKILKNTRILWDKVRNNADAILESRQTIINLHVVTGELSKSLKRLQEQSEQVATLLSKIGSPSNQVKLATQQIWYAERMMSSVQTMLSGESKAQAAATGFGQNVTRIANTINSLLDGDSTNGIRKVSNSSIRTILKDMANNFQSVQKHSTIIMNSTEELFKAHAAAEAVYADESNMLEMTGNLANSFAASSENRLPGNPLLSALLLVVVMLLFGALYIQQRRAEKEQIQYSADLAYREKEQNARNQEAIIRLLDEMEGLADGDLTAHATVTEDFTGAIADAMNYTIDQLRSLVSAINNTVDQVSESSTEARSTATELAQASRNQAHEITGASAAITDMASSIEEVSTNAHETSDMAQESVAIAKSGADIVRNSIKAMDTLREQIQETSKRIKRLGESSQEIGDIVALINDISDQTNILALNAAIQATMAGEAGRGFAVVSDEVQRLAERSGNAAKQIEGLVKTIQTDTNQAVISMESSTAEVVTGARLAQDAGIALERIESVSNDVAGLITSISESARQQAASAGQVTSTMMVIQDITTKTATGTEDTADSIGNLADHAEELKESVAGFKLPE